ncbi:MAG TPA: glycosyltransferase family 39 protein [Nitrospirales bacterium]|nr:glycosyltransferase family 39 protein [Nitrospirales bacterium]HIO20878.1 glycosyltransferase family 39 protein [Nitrospirales bacterium]
MQPRLQSYTHDGATMTSPHIRPYGILLFLCGVLFFSALGALNLTDNDEGSNAGAPREMLERGDWVSPTLNGEPRFAKPVFTYWLIGASYLVFGVNEFAARFPSAVFGTLLILMQYWFLSRVATVNVAWWSALCLLLNLEMLAIGRMVLTDMVLIFFTTLTLFSFWIAFSAEGREKRWYLVCYVATAGAMLTKGPVGVIVPLLVVLVFVLLTQNFRKVIREARPFAGVVLFCCLALPWYGAMLMIHGDTYLESAQANTLGRYASIIGGHGGTIFFYIPVLLLGFLPWSGFLPLALRDAVSNFKAHRTAGGRGQSLFVFAACWFVVVFLFFTLSATRLPHYIAPLFPAAAILVAFPIARLMSGEARPKATSAFWIIVVLGMVLGGSLAVFPFVYGQLVEFITKEFPMAGSVDPGIGISIIGMAMFIGFVATAFFGIVAKRVRMAIRIAAVTIGLSALLIIHVGLPIFDKHFLSRPHVLASLAGDCIGADDALVVYGRTKPSYVFYARHKIIFTHKGHRAPLDRLINEGRAITLMTQERLLPELPADLQQLPLVKAASGYVLLSERTCGT